ncbi:MAG: hypothetical protein N3H84_04355 [Candidatus Caldarchaeum sp.]|nr:hypothetical protein [Candidatus Caldarchaeum sp.]
MSDAAEACHDGFGAATDVDVLVVLSRPLGLGEGAKLRAEVFKALPRAPAKHRRPTPFRRRYSKFIPQTSL